MNISLSNIPDVYRSKKASVETMELKGYELVKELFVDSSGFGASDEPALTKSQFETELEALLTVHGSLYATVTNSGQFQVYVGLFKKTGKNRARKVANNTYIIEYSDHQAVRLHDTDILQIFPKYIVLNSGGWKTNTTKTRMNQFLRAYCFNISVFQKDFEWFIKDVHKNVVNKYVDGSVVYR